MAGESVAGVLVSLTRIITKLAIESERLSSIIFFTISLLFVVACFCCHIFIQCSPFVKYHTAQCQKSKKPKDDHDDDKDRSDFKMKEFASNLETNGTETTPARKSADPDDHDDFSGMSDNDDDEVKLIPDRHGNGDHDGSNQWSKTFMRGLKIRWVVVKQIWSLMIAIFANYFVTLLVFPGLVSEVQFCEIGDWMPVILIAVFNATDFVSKWLALLPCALKWPSLGLMAASISRVILVPVILLCIVPSPSSPVVGGVAVVGVAVVFNFLLGITNGFFGSLPMINVSKEVDKDRDRELAGSALKFSVAFKVSFGREGGGAFTSPLPLGSHSPPLKLTLSSSVLMERILKETLALSAF